MDEFYMSEALKEADKAAKHGEVPVGAIIVQDGEIIARAYNKREQTQIATTHAEILAIEQACEKIGYWRLTECTMYVTLEPCPMCAGALVNSRVKRLVFGACDPKAGASGSVLNITQNSKLNHQLEVTTGVMEQECSDILKKFFKQLRKKT